MNSEMYIQILDIYRKAYEIKYEFCWGNNPNLKPHLSCPIRKNCKWYNSPANRNLFIYVEGEWRVKMGDYTRNRKSACYAVLPNSACKLKDMIELLEGDYDG